MTPHTTELTVKNANNKIFFFNICRIDVIEAVMDMYKVYPAAFKRIGIEKDENGDGFCLVFPDGCPAEWIFTVGSAYVGIIQRKNPFKEKV